MCRQPDRVSDPIAETNQQNLRKPPRQNEKIRFGEHRGILFNHIDGTKLIAPCTRTHRERKEAYTKSLEQEVIQLRANEAKIMQETRKLYAELTALKNLMASNGIQAPTSFKNDIAPTTEYPSEEFDLSIQITNTKQKRRQIQIYKHSDQRDNHQCEASSATQTASQASQSLGCKLRTTVSLQELFN
jgi:beta-xylosidase